MNKNKFYEKYGSKLLMADKVKGYSNSPLCILKAKLVF